MSSCIKDLYDYDLVKKMFQMWNHIIKEYFCKDSIKKDG